MRDTIEVQWDMLGAKLAALGDEEQAKFFHGFAHELASSCYDSHYRREMQMLAIGEHIPPDSRKVLEEYMPCLWYKEAAEKSGVTN